MPPRRVGFGFVRDVDFEAEKTSEAESVAPIRSIGLRATKHFRVLIVLTSESRQSGEYCLVISSD